MLACGLIDLGMFLSIRFMHYGLFWPDSYEKLTISKSRLFRNQVKKFFSVWTRAIKQKRKNLNLIFGPWTINLQFI